MLREYYQKLLPVYFCDSKKPIFCCRNCVWFDDGKKQDCVNCKVNVMACMGSGISSTVKKSPKLSMLTIANFFDMQIEAIISVERSMKQCIKYGHQLFSFCKKWQIVHRTFLWCR